MNVAASPRCSASAIFHHHSNGSMNDFRFWAALMISGVLTVTTASTASRNPSRGRGPR